MAVFQKVASTSDIPAGTMKAIEVGHNRILVCNLEGTFYAIADECTHDSAPISTGRLFKEQVVCPRHGARFNVKTGAVEAPPAIVPVETFEVRLDGDEILVALD
jgi:3-phenylpropionate/trans-cinnamate dioxygenase ferredoxin subunit